MFASNEYDKITIYNGYEMARISPGCASQPGQGFSEECQYHIPANPKLASLMRISPSLSLLFILAMYFFILVALP
jgi:hypothetical protein